MEAILTSGGEDHLIQGLAFKPPSQTAKLCIGDKAGLVPRRIRKQIRPSKLQSHSVQAGRPWLSGKLVREAGVHIEQHIGAEHDADRPDHEPVQTRKTLCFVSVH